jgi:alpha-amylase
MSDRHTAPVGKSRLRTWVTLRRLIAVGAVGGTAALSVSAIGPATASDSRTTPASSKHATTRDVIANLWEWNWKSVAKECTTVLGPHGYGGVQVAPPQNSVTLNGSLGTPVHPWWEVYQPVNYTLTSRMGNEAQFKSMVATCRKAGVKVFVDAVINHMARDGHDSYSGAHFDRYNYPGLYTRKDFHSYPADCPVPPPAADPTTAAGQITILNFNDYRQVTKCELLALPDLRTETSYVRRTIAGYLNKLIGYGVSGFRVDAAKHIGQADLSAIKGLLHRTVDGDTPYLALEVFPGPGALSMFAFQEQGSLLGFDFAYAVHDLFKSYDPAHVGNITGLRVFGEKAGMLPRNKTLVFVENHDTERGDTTLSYRDGATNTLANEFMLAYGYGRPQVYASYAFQGLNPDSPPSNARGIVKNTDCSRGWVCVDRYTGVANMVGWHNFVGTASLRNWYDDKVNLIAFSRGDKGWIAINNHATAQTHTFQTGLSAGRYCDIIHGNVKHGTCTGPTITVNTRGRATITVAGKDSVAIYTAGLIRT